MNQFIYSSFFIAKREIFRTNSSTVNTIKQNLQISKKKVRNDLHFFLKNELKNELKIYNSFRKVVNSTVPPNNLLGGTVVNRSATLVCTRF